MLDWKNPRFVVAVDVVVVIVVVIVSVRFVAVYLWLAACWWSPSFLLCCWLLSSFVVVAHSSRSSFVRAKFVHYHWKE